MPVTINTTTTSGGFGTASNSDVNVTNSRTGPCYKDDGSFDSACYSAIQSQNLTWPALMQLALAALGAYKQYDMYEKMGEMYEAQKDLYLTATTSVGAVTTEVLRGYVIVAYP